MTTQSFNFVAAGILLAVGLPILGYAADKPPLKFDILIRHGTVIDGSGKPGVRADVGIVGGRIAAVGKLKGATGTVIIDAADLIVSPGFIDLHSHADRGILSFAAAENYIRQGATTLVCGNCGSSPTDVKAFFAALRKKGTGPNIAVLIGHGSVRESVLGRIKVAPSDKQLAQMKRLVRRAMEAGAVGMSTSLRYGAGAYASTGEIIELAKVIAPYGGFYATHMRDEGTRIMDAVEEALEIGRKAGVPVHISHHKISSASVFGLTRWTLARIDEARAAGVDVTLDQYPYGAGSGGMSLYVPQASLSGGLDAFRRRIADPKQKAAIVKAVEELLVRKLYERAQRPDDPAHTAAALNRIQVARARHDPKLEGKRLTQILRSRNQAVTLRNGAKLLVELVGHGTRGINHTIDARPGGDVDRVMRHPLTSIASDGSVFEFGRGHPHPRSYGCFTRVLGHYVRQRKLLTLPQAIHKMTQLPARRLGWKERGMIKPGYWADVVVFNPRTVSDKATFVHPHEHSVGIDHVIVRGQFVLKSGKMTGTLSGRPVGLGDASPSKKTSSATGQGDTEPRRRLNKTGRLDDAHLTSDQWPQFRGPNATGVSQSKKPLPGDIGPDKHVLWKTPLAGGHSSPVVFGDRIYLTAFKERRLLTIALDRGTGEVLWERSAPYQKLESVHKIGSPATSSVATDGERVFSFFGSSGLYCYDRGGRLLWRKKMGPFNNQFGAASSPILAGDLIVMVQDHDTGSFLAAWDKRDGQEAWRTERPNFRRNYTTPVLWRVKDALQIVVAGSAQINGYALQTGKLLWTVRGAARVVNSTPVVGDDGVLYVVNTGGGAEASLPSFKQLVADADANKDGLLSQTELPRSTIKRFFGQFDRDGNGTLDEKEYESIRGILGLSQSVALAIRPGGRGDVTKTHVLWRYSRSIPRNSSPLYYQGHLYLVKDGGVLTTLDAKTGRVVKQGRLRGTGKFFSSPVLGDGKIYVVSDRGKLNVISAEPNWRQLSTADFGEDVYATPAIVAGKIYLRTSKHLYCFGSSKK